MSKLKFVIIIVNLSLLGIQFLLTSAYSVGGRDLNSLSAQIAEIRSQNNQLRLAIWAKSSLASIQKSASKLNFVPAKTAVLSPLSTAMAP